MDAAEIGKGVNPEIPMETSQELAHLRLTSLDCQLHVLEADKKILKTSLREADEKLTTLNCEVEVLQRDNNSLKTDLTKAEEKLTELNRELQNLQTDKEILKTNLREADEKLTALSNDVKTLQSDQEIMKTNLNKAEEEVKSLSMESRALGKENVRLRDLLEDERRHRSERKHSASNQTKRNLDEIGNEGHHSVLDIEQRQEQSNKNSDGPVDGQVSSEGEEPTELDPKDKGLFNFLKAASNVACTATNAFNVGFAVLAYSASGHHATNELQKLLLVIGATIYMPFSILAAGMAHTLETKAKDIDIATIMVFAEMSYTFLSICMVALFVAKTPWFVVVPVFLLVWLFTANWLVSRYRRPRCLYRRFKSLKRWFKFKPHKQ